MDRGYKSSNCNKSGQSVIFDVEGEYHLWEVKKENGEYQDCSKTNPIKVGTKRLSFGQKATITAENQKLKKIKKTDEDTQKELNNVRFVIQYQDGTYIKEGADNTVEYTDKSNATWYAPEDYIQGLWKDGTYTYLEVQRESEFYEFASLEKPIVLGRKSITVPKYTDYEKDPRTGELKEVIRTGRANLDFEETNKRIYVRISGYVWEDKPSDGKVADYDDLYQEGTTDKRVQHVTVRIKDKDGNILTCNKQRRGRWK